MFSKRLVIKPHFSPQLAIFFIGLHSLSAAFVLTLFPAVSLYKILIIILIAVSAIYYYQLHIRKQSRRSVEQVSLTTDNQWEVMLARDQTEHNATLLATSFIHRILIILNFKTLSGERYTLIVPSDAIEASLARKLRARIRVFSL